MASKGGALFGASAVAQKKNLVEFKCGKMEIRGTTVHPDKRKGLAYLNVSEEGILHLNWKDREASVAADDYIIMPEECAFMRVEKCAGRVYVLRYHGSRSVFFYMQEPKESKDKEIEEKMNQYIVNPPTRNLYGRSGGVNFSTGEASRSLINSMNPDNMESVHNILGNADLVNLLNSMGIPTQATQQSLVNSGMDLIGDNSRPSVPASNTTTAPAAEQSATANSAAASNRKQRFNLNDLQNILSSIPTPPDSARSSSSKVVDLYKAINPEKIAPLLADKKVIDELNKHLPPGEQQEEGNTSQEIGAATITDNIRSPQFQSALRQFGYAFQTGQLADVLRHFNLSDAAIEAARVGNLEAFAEALEKMEAPVTATSTADVEMTETTAVEEKKDEPMDE